MRVWKCQGGYFSFGIMHWMVHFHERNIMNGTKCPSRKHCYRCPLKAGYMHVWIADENAVITMQVTLNWKYNISLQNENVSYIVLHRPTREFHIKRQAWEMQHHISDYDESIIWFTAAVEWMMSQLDLFTSPPWSSGRIWFQGKVRVLTIMHGSLGNDGFPQIPLRLSQVSWPEFYCSEFCQSTGAFKDIKFHAIMTRMINNFPVMQYVLCPASTGQFLKQGLS